MILPFLASRLGQGVTIAVALVIALIVNNAHQRSIGAEKVVAKIEKATNENVKKAEAARRSVDGLPDDRLRDKFTRD